MQAYFDNNEENNCLSCALIKTIDLYETYLETPALFRTNYSDNEFLYIKWDDIEEKVKAWRVEKPKPEPVQQNFQLFIPAQSGVQLKIF